MKKYFLHTEKGQEGPFDIEELKIKNISKETPVWFDGIEDWTEAEKVTELKTIFSSGPPPFKKKSDSFTSKNEINPIIENNQNLNKTVGIKKYVPILGILVLLLIFIINQYSNHDNSYEEQSYEEKVMTVEEAERSQPAVFLTADGTYNENFWGTKLRIHGTIKNAATVAIYKDAIIKVIYYSKTKTEVGNKQYTVYENFPPNSITKFELKIDNYRNVESIGWEVINAIAK